MLPGCHIDERLVWEQMRLGTQLTSLKTRWTVLISSILQIEMAMWRWRLRWTCHVTNYSMSGMPVPGMSLYMYSIAHDYTRTSSVGPVVRRPSCVVCRQPP